MHGHLFPPVIRRATLTESHLSPYMKQRLQDAKLNETVIQTFNGKQMLLMTSLVKFYMDIGLKICNITRFVQYVGGKSLLPFADKVYNLRCEATRENDDPKQLTAKLFGNSGYGKCGER